MKQVFDIIRFCRDFHIPYDDSGAEVTEGWINIRCPFCGGKHHLGVSTRNGSISCWRCGRHKTPELLRRFFAGRTVSVSDIMQRYLKTIPSDKSPVFRGEMSGFQKTCQVPTHAGPLSTLHRRYLEGRKFDPDEITRVWGILGTGPFGDYKYRIIAPITLDGFLVSYQGRDITGKQKLRYKACAIKDEAVHHKHILYGVDLLIGRRAVVVEGITDAWRLGAGAIATFGTAYTREQERFIAERLDEAFLLFDSSDDHAVSQMQQLGERLSLVMDKVEMVQTDWKDPGEAPQEEADALMAELGFGDRKGNSMSEQHPRETLHLQKFPSSLRQKLKVASALRGLTMAEYVAEIITPVITKDISRIAEGGMVKGR